MSKKNLKRFMTVALVASMTLGSTLTVCATEGVAEGTGSYEGGELKYPTLSITLPTIPAGTYDYIADPNGLIEKTKADDGTAAKYANSTFTGTTGIFFLTSTANDGAKTYTENSAALTLTNENAQDIDVTVKLEQKTEGDASIVYADSAQFDADDTENKLYLAITDGAADNAQVSALSLTGAAVVKTTVAGVPGNYEASYDTTNGYGYVKKADADLTDWNDCSFYMTGALNTGATWGDAVAFPTIQVTWSYAEHRDSALSSSTISSSSNSLTVTGANVTGVTLVKTTNAEIACTAGTHYTFADGTLTVMSSMLGSNVGGQLKVTLDTGVTETITIE